MKSFKEYIDESTVNLKSDALSMDKNSFLQKHSVEGPNLEPHDYIPFGHLDPSEGDSWKDWHDDITESGKKTIDINKQKVMAGKRIEPIIVRGRKDHPKFRPMVIDGHHRAYAHKEGNGSIPVRYDRETLINIWNKHNE